MPISTCVFDAYGTLFDVNAAARLVAQDPAHATFAAVWPQLAKDWRAKQLEYSWLRAIADQHCDFWQVTQDGLDWAMDASGVSDAVLRDRLLALYWELPAYNEVSEMLKTLKSKGLSCAILSNGSPEMLQGAVASAGLGPLLDDVLSVEDVRVFKPHNRVYTMVTDRFDCAASDVLFVSSNGWDAAGAAHFGFKTVWVNRADAPVDRLFATPDHILSDLTKIPEFA